MAAFEAAGDPERFPEAGEPWQVLKPYYHHSFNRPRMVALHEATVAHGLESPWASASSSGPPSRSGTRGSRRGCPAGEEARGARPGADGPRHPDRPRRALVQRSRAKLQEKVWPTEDYELVASHVDSPVPEDDLFAGVEAPVADDAVARPA